VFDEAKSKIDKNASKLVHISPEEHCLPFSAIVLAISVDTDLDGNFNE
jgi:hypothetical protein